MAFFQKLLLKLLHIVKQSVAEDSGSGLYHGQRSWQVIPSYQKEDNLLLAEDTSSWLFYYFPV